jgi:glucans biosynthesis protein
VSHRDGLHKAQQARAEAETSQVGHNVHPLDLAGVGVEATQGPAGHRGLAEAGDQEDHASGVVVLLVEPEDHLRRVVAGKVGVEAGDQGPGGRRRRRFRANAQDEFPPFDANFLVDAVPAEHARTMDGNRHAVETRGRVALQRHRPEDSRGLPMQDSTPRSSSALAPLRPPGRAPRRGRRPNFGLRAALALLALLPACGALAFSADDVTARAEALAREPYADHRKAPPPWLLAGSMSYDAWRDIRFRPERALWRSEGLPFQVQFFHPGIWYDRSVAVHVVEAGRVAEVPFDQRSFDYGKNDFASRIPADIGWAGFRLHAPLRTKDYFDELVVFLGATYFRALGRDNVYGISARGIAVDTVDPAGEEFPHFVEFWIEKPARDASSVVVHALMEGPSIAGAYRFEIRPGESTVIAVDARLFPRREIRKLGIAPLTSMFWFGENSRVRFDDFRPEVHDSDGLLVHFSGGEWLWRPLTNPKRISASGFAMENPRGFGLMQRDRAFASYQDLETRAEKRPSTWVEPRGNWGRGRVELDEIPTDGELVDNIVAYWVPEAPPAPGRRFDLAYTVSFFTDDAALPPGGRVLATRCDGGVHGDRHRFVIDFGGRELNALTEARPPVAVVTTSPPNSAELTDQHVVRNPDTGGWRLGFQLRAKSAEPIELRAFLRGDRAALTETWSSAVLP